MEKYGKTADWGNTTWAATAGLGSIGLMSHHFIIMDDILYPWVTGSITCKPPTPTSLYSEKGLHLHDVVSLTSYIKTSIFVSSQSYGYVMEMKKCHVSFHENTICNIEFVLHIIHHIMISWQF